MIRFSVWLESILPYLVYSKKTKKISADHFYPFIITPSHVFIGPPDTLHADVEMEFMQALGREPKIYGRFGDTRIRLFAAEKPYHTTAFLPALQEMLKTHVLKPEQMLIYPNYTRHVFQVPLGKFLQDEQGEPTQDPREKEIATWIAGSVATPEEIRQARKADVDSGSFKYAYRYGESFPLS